MAAIAELDLDIDYASSELRRLYAGVSVSIVRITAEIAADLLSRNTVNRPLKKAHVKFFCDVLGRGDMVFNGETIILAPDGTLLNGQHRLSAALESGVPFDALIVRGVDVERFKTMDSGDKRTAANALAIDGETNVTALAAAIQAFVSFCANRGVIRASGAAVLRATGQVCDRVLSRHPQIRKSLRDMHRNSLYKSQHAVALHYLFWMVDRDLASDFASILADGPASASDRTRPFNVLREQLIASPLKTHTREKYAAKAIKAFNAEQRGASPKVFSFGDREDFPMIDGLDYDRLKDLIS